MVLPALREADDGPQGLLTEEAFSTHEDSLQDLQKSILYLEQTLERLKSSGPLPIHPLGSSDNPSGGPYDITPAKAFSQRVGGTPPRLLIIHWGNNDALGLAGYFKRARVSAHWAVDETGCWQMLDHRHRAWHAEAFNNISVGFDIASSPLVARFDNYTKVRGRDVRIVDNPTKRGERRVMTLDPRIAENVRTMTFYLADKLNIPLVCPRDSNGRVRHDLVFRTPDDVGEWSGIIGHHHCASSKWDIAPWWDQIFAGTPLG